MRRSDDTHLVGPFPQHVSLHLEDAIARMGDREIYLEIARYFAGHMEQTLTDLETALKKEDLKSATRLAHSLKSNCATMGAYGLQEKCLHLEHLCGAEDRDTAFALYTALVPKFLELRALLQAL